MQVFVAGEYESPSNLDDHQRGGEEAPGHSTQSPPGVRVCACVCVCVCVS